MRLPSRRTIHISSSDEGMGLRLKRGADSLCLLALPSCFKFQSFEILKTGDADNRTALRPLKLLFRWNRYHFYGSDSIARNYTSGKNGLSSNFLGTGDSRTMRTNEF